MYACKLYHRLFKQILFFNQSSLRDGILYDHNVLKANMEQFGLLPTNDGCVRPVILSGFNNTKKMRCKC